jgi:hypothetical protein
VNSFREITHLSFQELKHTNIRKMVARDDSNSYLLRGSLGRCRSDDLSDLFLEIDAPNNEPTKKYPLQRARMFERLRKKVANRGRSKGKKKRGGNDDDKENCFLGSRSRPSPASTNLSSYDERSILDRRDGPPEEEDDLIDTLSIASSVLSTESNQKSQRRLVKHWKSCMSSSVRKLLRKEIWDKMKGKPTRYKDFGFYVYPDESMFNSSRERKRSAFNLLLPTLETPPASQDEASNAGNYNGEDDFPLKSLDAIAIEEASLQMDTITEDQEPQRLSLQPRKSNHNLFVSFDEDMAQLIFDVPSSDTENFQAVDVESVVSDIDPLSDEEDEFTVTFPAYKVGAAYSHPGLPTIAQSASNETEETPRPLGISCGHPYAYSHKVDEDVWSNVNAPLMDGEVTDPPSPIPVNKSCENYWTLGQAYSNESDLTMTDVLLNRHECFPTDFASALPELPLPRNLMENYPFDEHPDRSSHENRMRRSTEQAVSTGVERYMQRTAIPVPYDEFADRERVARRRPKQAKSKGIEPFLHRGPLLAFRTDRDEERHAPSTGRSHIHRATVNCGCVKCTAKSIYQDLLQCNGGSVD